MRLRPIHATLRAAISALWLLVAPAVALAQSPCESTDPGAENACFARRAASGEYQRIIDELETRVVGLSPYQQYFLGTSYFALAARTGADSLRCFWNARARSLLESFLEERQQFYSTHQSFGNADEMKYSYVAARIVESARSAAVGCEQTGESRSSLERHARSYLGASVKDLFFSYGSSGAPASVSSALRATFNTKLGHVQDAVRKFIADASRIETNFELTKLELAAGKRDVTNIINAVNGWQAGAIVQAYDGPGGTLRISFPGPLDTLLGQIGAKQREYQALARSGGALGDAKAEVDGFVARAGASSMADYQAKRAAIAVSAQQLAADLATVANQSTLVSRTDAVARLSSRPTPPADGIDARWSAIELAWRKARPGCTVNPNKWYCK